MLRGAHTRAVNLTISQRQDKCVSVVPLVEKFETWCPERKSSLLQSDMVVIFQRRLKVECTARLVTRHTSPCVPTWGQMWINHGALQNTQ